MDGCALTVSMVIFFLSLPIGYGARWLHDGSEFRGFLEPQMEDGHQIGWKH